MKKLFLGFVFLLFAVWLGYLVHQDSGYILIAYSGWTLETSLWVGVIALVLIFVIVYLILRFIRHTSTFGSRMQAWGSRRRDKKARKHGSAGLCELAEGNWQKAESFLHRAAKHSKEPLIHYLAAARAAHKQKAYDRRDTHLRKAHKMTKGSEVAVGLTQAELQMSGEQWEQALATLKHLNQIAPQHQYVLTLLKNVYLELKDWKHLHDLLPSLRKAKTMSPDKLDQLEEVVYIRLLKQATVHDDELEKTWQSIPRSWQSQPAIVDAYVRALLKKGEAARAIPLIEAALKKHWSPLLLHHYGLLVAGEDQRQLNHAEAWLKKHPHDPDLLLCLGRLSIRSQLWGKARHYLEECLTIAPLVDVYQEMGRVLEALGEKEAALEHYRQGLLIKDNALSEDKYL